MPVLLLTIWIQISPDENSNFHLRASTQVCAIAAAEYVLLLLLRLSTRQL